MRKRLFVVVPVCLVLMCLLSGCANVDVSRLKLGMSPAEVVDQIGRPYTIRAAKTYDDNQWTEVWEYMPPFFSFRPKGYWIYFENGKVVQWGEPGDFFNKNIGMSVPVGEYSEQKKK